MAKRRLAKESTTAARWLWGTQGARLFDPGALEYEPWRVGLSRAEIVSLLKSGDLPLATHICGGGVTWSPATSASAGWMAIEADFEDVEGWRPPSGEPGTLQYRAELWRALRGERRVLVLRND